MKLKDVADFLDVKYKTLSRIARSDKKNKKCRMQFRLLTPYQCNLTVLMKTKKNSKNTGLRLAV